MKWLALAAFLTACDSEAYLPRTPELDRLAMGTVWHGSFGRSDAAPAVEFVDTPECDESGYEGIWLYHSLTGRSCVRGYTLPRPEVIRLFYGGSYSDSPLAHELCHILVMRTTNLGDDPGHTDPRFYDDTVPNAIQALRNEGL